MVKTNYSAWNINAKEFSDDWTDTQKLGFFARYAILAPSGHNIQPWRFTYAKQALLLKEDRNRRLPYSGVQANEPFVSLGACLGVMQLAAKGFGYTISIDYILKDDVVASVKLAGKTAADPSLLDAITHRVSNRSYYETKSLPEALTKSFTKSELKNVSTLIITNRDDIAYIADLTTRATLISFSDKKFRAELSKWVRNNLTRRYDGMPGYVQGIPTPPSMLAKHIVKGVDISKDQAKKDSNRVLHSGSLVIITIHNTKETALMDGGRMYAQVCVLAQQQGIATTGAGAAIIEPVTIKELTKKYNLPGKPIAVIRLGRPVKPAKHTPRMPLSMVTD